MPLNKDLNLLFIHIPRTSGTTFEKNILKINESHKTNYDIITGDGVLNNRTFMSMQHLTNKLINKYYKDKIENIKKITIIRNPIDRIISIYFNENYKREDKKIKIRYFNDHFYVNNFIDFLKIVKKNLESDNPYFFWQSQYDYLKDNNGDINIDYILRFEDFPDNFGFLNNKLKNIKNYLDINKSESQIKNLKEFNQSFIKNNPGSIDLIYEIYKKDIEIFNYNIKDYLI